MQHNIIGHREDLFDKVFWQNLRTGEGSSDDFAVARAAWNELWEGEGSSDDFVVHLAQFEELSTGHGEVQYADL